MKHLYTRILYLSIFISTLNFSQAQSNEIKIRFVANAGLHLTDGQASLYFDFPYKSGFWMYSKYDKSEIENIKDKSVFIFTHKHPDHYKRKLVKRLVKKRGAKAYGPWNVQELEQLNGSIKEFSIQAIKTSHKFSSKHCSYVITWHGKKIYINGDTEGAEQVGKLKDMDWVFVPAWTLVNANAEKIKIDTKMLGIYHIGPKDKVNSTNPKILVMDKQGEVISLPYE